MSYPSSQESPADNKSQSEPQDPTPPQGSVGNGSDTPGVAAVDTPTTDDAPAPVDTTDTTEAAAATPSVESTADGEAPTTQDTATEPAVAKPAPVPATPEADATAETAESTAALASPPAEVPAPATATETVPPAAEAPAPAAADSESVAPTADAAAETVEPAAAPTPPPAAEEPSPDTVSEAAAVTEEAAAEPAAAPTPVEDPTPVPAEPIASAEPDAGESPPATPAELAKPTVDMNALLEQKSGSADDVQQVKAGDRVSGVLVRLGEENCFIDFGGRSEGLIRTTELKGDDGELAFRVGEPLEAFVISATDNVVLSRFVSGEARQADTLYKAYKAGIPIEGKVMAVNKWGIGVDLEGMRAFCPVSQVDTQFTEDLEQYRDKKMTFKIIRFRDHGRSIVLSRRALLEAEQEKDAVGVREKIAEGMKFTGTVTRLENFGAFVDLGSRVEGLIHVSEMRHERVNHPQDVVKAGDEVTVKVIAVKNLGDRRKERISLSIKALEKDPWDEVRSQFTAGTVTMGKIEGIEEYGVFVELAPNVRGLIHVSELADRRVNHPRDVVSVGDEVKVAVLEVDNKRKRLRLSIRRAEQVEGATNLKEFAQRQAEEKASEGVGNATMFEALKRAKLVE